MIASEQAAIRAPPTPCAARASDQRRAVRREPAGQRGEPEHEQRHDEHAALAEVVGRAAAEHQEAGERDRVGVDYPLQFRRREAEAQLDRGQRDVDDAQVEDDHELRHAAHAKQPSLARAQPALGRLGAVLLGFVGAMVLMSGGPKVVAQPQKDLLRATGSMVADILV